ncbi:MAG: PAS domain-containing protein [Nitrospira sp.]|nr:PAS domain-containing protein [Nitrospira sp.]
MDKLLASDSNQPSVNHPSLSSETFTGYGAWEWDIVSGDVQWFGISEWLFGSLSEPGNRNIQVFTDNLHPDDRTRVWQTLNSLMARRQIPYGDEYRFILPDGSVRWISAMGRFYYDDAGKAVRMTGVAQDITERKQTEARLLENEERLSLAQSAANIGSFDWNIQAQTIVWSREMERIWGLPVGGFGGTYQHWRRQIHPDDMEEAERIIRRSLGNPEISYKYEHRIIRPDGTVRWIQANVTTRRNRAGRSIRMVGVNFDITERKEAEGKLRESEARFRNVFEHAGTGIAIVNLDGTFVQCNPAYHAMLGHTEAELLDVHFSEVVHVEDRDTNLAAIRLLLTEVLPYFEIENRYMHKNGEPVWVRKFISLLRDDEGRPTFVVALVTDITERRKAEHELHQSKEHLHRWAVELEKAMNEKTAELMQSQGRLRGLASELSLAEQRERKRLATELHDHLQQLLVLGKLTIGQSKRSAVGSPGCETALNRVDDILSEALSYSRTLVTDLSPAVLRDHGLAAGLEWLGAHMKKYNQTVTVKVPKGKEMPLPEDHVSLLFQSVRELLVNSSKHAGTGQATVTMEQGEKNLRITVSDDGAGFDPAATAGIPSGEISSKFGLFSIQDRMRVLGGSCIIRSVLGQGVTATLTLPLARKPDDTLLSPEFPEASVARQSSER